MKTKKVSIADFSETPYGRTEKDGPHHGTKFRREHLVPALRQYEIVEVDLDGTEGYGSSFLEEAFGGLISEGFSKSDLKNRLQIKTTDPGFQMYKNAINKYIEDRAK